jgi:glutamyl/glutaminyl-tRNA synthetase
VRRENTIEFNLDQFEKLLQGVETEWCLRAKANMKSVNGCMRDPVLYRYNADPHLRTGTTFKAYPTYDFACPIVDSIEGVTHAMRTLEYKDRDEQYYWMLEALRLRPVKIVEFSRLNFQYTLLSKRKLTWFVNEGVVDGWMDPRFPTVQGMLRRGLVVENLRKFMIAQGASKRVVDMEWDKFWSDNARMLDPITPRYMAITTAGAVPIRFTGGDDVPAGVEARTLALHDKNTELGVKVSWRDLYVECHLVG